MTSENEYASGQQDGSYDDAWLTTSPRPTYAAFSPNQHTATSRHARSSIIIHQKSPLLIATPPQVTRALAYSHAFILPLSNLVGLVSWTTEDPWKSFLLLIGFWFAVLYGDVAVLWAGPLLVVTGLILGMYTRRYSPLSSTVWSGQKVSNAADDADTGRKSLDEILATLQTFTMRCQVLLEPFQQLTDFLSTQSTATSATTRPALTILFMRILAFSPFWTILMLPPLELITARRIVLVVGTLILSWHSPPAQITRVVLWRSRSVRVASGLLTGMDFVTPPSAEAKPALPPRDVVTSSSSKAKTKARAKKPTIRFTFTVYENQRRWLGLGWTHSLLAYERQAWTDEHLNACADVTHFQLPETDNESTHWQWVEGSRWRIASGTASSDKKSADEDVGWTFCDNKWQGPLKEDGWGRYTRYRKWVRDAELIEIAPEVPSTAVIGQNPANENAPQAGPTADALAKRKKGWFSRRSSNASVARSVVAEHDRSDTVSKANSNLTNKSSKSRDDSGDDAHGSHRYRNADLDRSIGDGLAEGLS